MSAQVKEPAGAAPRFKIDLTAGVWGPLIGLLALYVFFAFKAEHFFTIQNAIIIFDQVTVYGILAIGMTLVIITGGIDLSVGSVLAFSAMTTGWLFSIVGMPFFLALLCGLATGAAAGLVSGLLITYARLPPFIATLAMMTIARGLANKYTDGNVVSGWPDALNRLNTYRYFGIFTATTAFFLLLVLSTWAFLKFRPAGRNLYAIGGNPEVARLAGIPVRLYIVSVYVMAGVLSAVAGMANAARLQTSQPYDGLGYELTAIAAVVIGGASLSGGVGSMGGTLIGVLIIGVLNSGLSQIGAQTYDKDVIIGVMIAAAVAFDTLIRRRR
ncbi:MAG TPA: ABC transporter permease [Lichenihabitans sp.]|jgi:ribose transport system permease protein|nr:ABC transporter permease [Lichenihabitans sp.]